jgi:hypothetical protein
MYASTPSRQSVDGKERRLLHTVLKGKIIDIVIVTKFV